MKDSPHKRGGGRMEEKYGRGQETGEFEKST